MLRYLVLLCLLTTQAYAQSTVVSGGRGSIIISGTTPSVTAPKTAPTPSETEQLRKEIEDLKQSLKKATEKPAVIEKPVAQKPVVQKPARREWYLISESWCQYCPAAKARFLAKGWPESNILTMAECQAKFGFTHNPPFEFGDPNHPDAARQKQRVVQSVPRPAPQPFVRQQQYSRPAVNWGGRMYTAPVCNNPNCRMCNAIRAGLSQYRPMKYVPPQPKPAANPLDLTVSAEQQPTDEDVVRQMIRLMDLTDDDVHADLGCGDGRICIEAVRKTGCRSIGVEIDPEMAQAARRLVAEAGLSDKIEIICGDALEFDPEAHGVTAITAYLFPDLLEKLLPTFRKVRVVGSPYHQIHGLPMMQHGDVWIYTAVQSMPQLESRLQSQVARSPGLFGIMGTSHESRETLIHHLLYEGEHRGRHSASSLHSMSDQQLCDLHDRDHR